VVRRQDAAAQRLGVRAGGTSTAAWRSSTPTVGKGKLVLFGPQVLFRAQPHGTFKFFFNAIVREGVDVLSEPEA
jgi:hypothetical protein